jgi:RimJ/RimL family protein N-acetyltransferase
MARLLLTSGSDPAKHIIARTDRRCKGIILYYERIEKNPFNTVCDISRPPIAEKLTNKVRRHLTSITQAYFMQTARLGFRYWRPEDLAIALELWGDVRVTRFIDARGKLSRAQVQERLEAEIAGQIEFGLQYWPIFLLASNAHVGCCGLRPYDPARQIYEIGFHIRSAHWRHGYASEAARAVMVYAFEELHVAGLFAGHNPQNAASRLLLAKLGFRYTHDEYYPATGLDHPSYLMTVDDYVRLGYE